MPAVNVKRQAYDVLIDRRTKWGNDFRIGPDGTRDDVCEKHKRKLWADIRAGKITLQELAALKGKRLGCHCAPLRCHGDTLSAAADWAHAQLELRAA